MTKYWQINWSEIPQPRRRVKKVDTNYRCIMVFPIPADARSCVYIGPDNGMIRYGMTGMARPHWTNPTIPPGMIVNFSIEWFEFYVDIGTPRTEPHYFFVEPKDLYFGPSNP